MPNNAVRTKRRIQILEALHRCLLENPFHQTSIKDIANEAGVNHGLLHYYFQNKEDILLHYIDYTFEKYYTRFIEKFNLKLDQTNITRETMEDLFQWILREISFNPESARIFTEIWAHALYNRKVEKKLHDNYNKWQENVLKALMNFSTDRHLAKKQSLTLIAFWEGMSLFSIFYDHNDLCTDPDFSTLLKGFVHKERITT